MISPLARASFAGFVAIGIAGAASGEVRLQPAPRPPSVIVQQTSRGPWSPVSSVGDRVLNPSGDLVGDGAPAVAVVDGVAVVAWSRPGRGILVAWGADAWHQQQLLASPLAAGIPVLHALQSGFSAAWQKGGSDPCAEIAALSVAGSASVSVPVAQGALIGSPALKSGVLPVVTLSSDGMLAVTNVVFFYPMPSPPIIPNVRPTIDIERLPTGALLPADSLLFYPSPVPPLIERSFPDIRIHEGEHHGEPFALVTWWVAPDELHWIELTGDGPAFPVRTERSRGGAGYSPSLVEHAINEVRRK